ncbi:MAG: YidC/Oxa1 family insertase periplasmic-domain containing protein [Aureliella sp.]
MDRRFLIWLMLTSALCFLYLSQRPQEPGPDAEKPATAKANPDPLMRSGDASDPKAASDGTDASEAEGDNEDTNAGRPQNPDQVVTLGSMDSTKGFSLLVYLNARGASVERVELVQQTSPGEFLFRALEHDAAYLGYLAPREAVGGVEVRAVAEGSPANLATGGSGGIQVGDVIRSVNGVAVMTPLELENALDGIKAFETVDVEVARSGASGTSTINFSVKTCEPPLDLVRTQPWESEKVPGNLQRRALLTSLASIDGTRIPEGELSLPALAETLDTPWEVKPLETSGGQGFEFRLPLDSFLAGTGRPGKLDLVKRYRLLRSNPDDESAADPGYMLDLETVIENRNDDAVTVSLRQEGLPGLTLEGWWYSVKISPHMFSGAGNRDVIYNSRGAGHNIATTRQIQSQAKKEPLKPNVMLFSEGEPIESRSISYIGVDAQYFNASFLPHPEAAESLTDLRQAGAMAVANAPAINKSQAQATNTSFFFDTLDRSLASGEELTQRYQIYLGPKETETLEAHGLERAIEYGWFGWVAEPLGWILHAFYAVVRNYGIAIVMLTVLVRGCMFPLGRKAAMNAQRMQELQPELKKINDKYKDNMEKRAKAMQDLYAKHNFKPLAGCLPMFIQLPIFMGLYRCLSVDISLRQQPLIPGIDWCSNLAAPDQLVNWSSWMPEFFAGRGTGWLGPYFNILPLVTVALFILQQKMLMPKATDEQTRMTQNMMQVMTLFMGVLFFKVPSGLCIYFVTSSLWSLVERKLVKRFTPPSTGLATETNDSVGDKPSTAGNAASQSSKPASKFQELMKMLEKPGQTSATHRGTNKQKEPRSPSPNRPPPPNKRKKRRK